MHKVGERIKELRKKAGLTQAQLAEKLNVTPQNISQYERGLKNPKIGTLNKIAKALGVPVTELDPSIIPRPKFIPIGKRIESARIAQGVSVEELASRLGVPPEKVREYERGDAVPKKYTISLIAGKLGVEEITAFYPTSPEVKKKQGIDEISQIFAGDDDIEEREENIRDLREGKDYGIELSFKAIGVQKSADYSKMNTLLDKLNDEGQQKAIERVEELTEIPRYQRRADDGETKPDKDPE